MKESNCSCNNKEVVYVCRDTPTGTDCIQVDKVPNCYDRKVTFVKTE